MYMLPNMIDLSNYEMAILCVCKFSFRRLYLVTNAKLYLKYIDIALLHMIQPRAENENEFAISDSALLKSKSGALCPKILLAGCFLEVCGVSSTQ